MVREEGAHTNVTRSSKERECLGSPLGSCAVGNVGSGCVAQQRIAESRKAEHSARFDKIRCIRKERVRPSYH